MEIVFSNVGYVYNDNTNLKKEVLKDIDMTIKEGKISAIVGKSGSGKTTLIEMINGLIIPTKGNIKIGSFKINKKSEIKDINELRVNIGLVFETPENQFLSFTVKEELEFGMKAFNYQLDKLEERVLSSLKMVGLDESYLDKDPFTLSNGEKRKVAIASILTYNPKIIILDEPTVGLDEVSKNNLIKLFRILKNKYNKTIIIVSQDIDWLHKFVDEVFVIHNKKVVLSGNKYDVFSEEEKLKKYGINVPKIISFSNKVKDKKNIKMGYRDEINDLINDIYRYAR